MTQAELAEETDLAQSTVAQIESGVRGCYELAHESLANAEDGRSTVTE
jgi:transcriptional regulator with XRE-family HTH domain